MTEEVHDLAALYVVDALTPDETREFEAHVMGCAACQQEVAEMRSVTERLSRSVQTDPPEHLRSSVLAMISETPQQARESSADRQPHVGPEPADGTATVVPLRRRKANRLPYLVAAAGLLLAVAFGAWGLQNRHDAQQASDQQTAIVSLLGAPDVQTVTTTGPAGSTGTVVVSNARNAAVFVASSLPTLPSGKVYELWTIASAISPAGTFTPTTTHSLVKLPQAAVDASKIAVSVEPTGGSPQPTTTPIMVFDVPSA